MKNFKKLLFFILLSACTFIQAKTTQTFSYDGAFTQIDSALYPFLAYPTDDGINISIYANRLHGKIPAMGDDLGEYLDELRRFLEKVSALYIDEVTQTSLTSAVLNLCNIVQSHPDYPIISEDLDLLPLTLEILRNYGTNFNQIATSNEALATPPPSPADAVSLHPRVAAIRLAARTLTQSAQAKLFRRLPSGEILFSPSESPANH